MEQDGAKAQYDNIAELISALHTAEQEGSGSATLDGDTLDADSIRERIYEGPLSVEIRSGWYVPGQDHEPAEYCILLCTGGPAVRIVGDLDEHTEPDSARLEYQDWFTPWTEYSITHADDAVLLEYARHFFFGE